MSVNTGYRWKLETAQAAAERFMALWADTCEQAVIAGSIRRKKRGGVGDIEFLALPIFDDVPIAAVAAQIDMFGAATGGSAASTKHVSRLDVRLDELAAQGILFKDRPNNTGKGRWGEKQKKFWIKADHGDGIGYIAVDLFICTPPAQWGSLLVIRTGPKDFEQALMVYINEKTNLQQLDGRLIVRESGLSVPTPTEESYFKVIGLPYVPPHKRTADWANKWRRMRRTPVVYVPSSSTSLSGNRFQIGEKSGPDQPQPGEQSAAPDIADVVLPIDERIKDALDRLPGAHPTTLISRLGCDPVSFRLALMSLKESGVVQENHYGGLWLVNDDRTDLPEIRVVNVKTLPIDWQADPVYIYIGRAHHGKRLAGSPLGNPFVIGRDGTRDQVIAKYRDWITGQPHLLQMIPYLAEHAEALVCWCAPEACHGDVLVEYIERYRRGEWSPPSRKGTLGYNDNEVRVVIRARLEMRAEIE